MINLLGIDIGGTKCAVTYGCKEGNDLSVIEKVQFSTAGVTATVENIICEIEQLMLKHKLTPANTSAIGISCGGPLDSKSGTIMSPPNLPGWDNIPVVDLISTRFGIVTGIQNDANACALAEWQFGAGKGADNMVFLTFGTGLGAGLILNGKLYTGTNDNAGEVGHIRLSDFGPVGYGKTGSFEGFCSGGGIAQLAQMKILEKRQKGEPVNWAENGRLDKITARTVSEAAFNGDKLALEIYRISSSYLGKGLAIIIDLLNPEIIVIGSIYTRNKDLMYPYIMEEIEKEALSHASRVCTIKKAKLGEYIGDYAALSVAVNLIKEKQWKIA
jgi:glucokinase